MCIRDRAGDTCIAASADTAEERRWCPVRQGANFAAPIANLSQKAARGSALRLQAWWGFPKQIWTVVELSTYALELIARCGRAWQVAGRANRCGVPYSLSWPLSLAGGEASIGLLRAPCTARGLTSCGSTALFPLMPEGTRCAPGEGLHTSRTLIHWVSFAG